MKLRALRRPLRAYALWQAAGAGLIAVVVYMSLMTNPPNIPVTEGDKWGHSAANAGLMIWFDQLKCRTAHVRLGLGLLALGSGLEFALALTPDRSFDPWDMVADGGGVLLGWVLGGTAFGVLLQRMIGTRRSAQS